MTSYSVTVTDGVGANDVQHGSWGLTITETIQLPDLLGAFRAFPKTITDGIGINDALIRNLGVVVAEILQIGDTATVKQILHVLATESIFAADSIARGLTASITDGIGIHPSQTVAYLLEIVEKLGLHDTLGPAFKYSLSITEKLQFADLLARFIGAQVIENVQMVELLTGVGSYPKAIADGIGIHDTVNGRLLLRAIVEENLEITDAELLKMIFSAAVVEAIEVAAAYIAPNGSVTTWAMNTRTTAVTEYTNYNFNSFAQIGDKYLGATSDGLYELDGDTDAGTDIIANLKSGLAQFAGVHLSSFKGAYIAARGGGSYVLRIYTGTGEQYNFAVTTDSMKTARIDMGKGIRARFFAFELISSGQDFDLDSLEFIPLIAKRRV